MLLPRPGAASYRHPQRGLPAASREVDLCSPPTTGVAVAARGGFFPPFPLLRSARTTLPRAPRGAGRGARWGA